MNAPDADHSTVPMVAAPSTEATPEIKERPVEPTQPVAEIDPPHESGYGFGV